MLHPEGRKLHRDQTILYHLTPQHGRQNLLWDSGKEANPNPNPFMLDDYMDTSVQKGGVPEVPGCLEHTSVISKIIKDAKRNHGDLTVLWLDLTNAYGTIPHKLVETTLKTYHVPA